MRDVRGRAAAVPAAPAPMTVPVDPRPSGSSVGPESTRIRLDGPRTQGGLLQGRVAPGSGVEFEGTPVRVSEDGWFLVGFGRDAAPEAVLVVSSPDGGRERLVIAVAPREYRIERIDGLPAAKVAPRRRRRARPHREGGEASRGSPHARRPEDRFPERLPVAGHRPRQRRLRLAADPERRAAPAALRDRHRGPRRDEGPRSRGRTGHPRRTGPVPLRRDPHRRPRPRAVVRLPAPLAHPGRTGRAGPARPHDCGGRGNRPRHRPPPRLAGEPLRAAPRPRPPRRPDAEVAPRARR